MTIMNTTFLSPRRTEKSCRPFPGGGKKCRKGRRYPLCPFSFSSSLRATSDRG